MNNIRIILTLIWTNLVTAALATLWAYTSYKYNWLNVGGGTSPHKELWIAVKGLIPYAALFTWLFVLGYVLLFGHLKKFPVNLRIVHAFISLLIGPATLFVADWLFHRGFPAPLI